MTYRTLTRLAATAVLILSLSSCTAEQMIRHAFEARGATETQVDQAIRVAHCESRLQADAISPGGGNWGLFQINRVHRARVEAMGHRWEDMLRGYENARVAAAIWDEQGWRPWTCATSRYPMTREEVETVARLQDVCPATSKTAMDHATAEQEALRARRRTGDVIVEYRCRSCGWWHIGHPSGGRDRRRKRQRAGR